MASKKTPPAANDLPLLQYAGITNKWECDQWDHMNVRFYANRVYLSWGAFAAAINLPNAFQREAQSTLLPREMHIRFHRELRSGDYMVMRGGVVEITEESVVLYQELRKPNAGNELAATYRVILDHVEAKTGRPFPWPHKALEPLKRLQIDEIPKHGQARSIDLNAPAESGSLARALELGVPVNGLSLLTAAETDAFGRMLPELILGRQSDSYSGVTRKYHAEAIAALAEAGYEPVLSGAVLESRLVYRRWPKAGNLTQVHGAYVESGGKTGRFRVWNLDPVSGECWTETENVMTHFDMRTRKSYEPPAAYQALIQSTIIKGFTL